MPPDTPSPVRLEEYCPPDWLIETVDLDVALHPTETQVRATLQLRPNASGAPAPVVLDGDGLTLTALRIDGQDVPADRYDARADRLTIMQPPPRPFRLEIE